MSNSTLSCALLPSFFPSFHLTSFSSTPAANQFTQFHRVHSQFGSTPIHSYTITSLLYVPHPLRFFVSMSSLAAFKYGALHTQVSISQGPESICIKHQASSIKHQASSIKHQAPRYPAHPTNLRLNRRPNLFTSAASFSSLYATATLRHRMAASPLISSSQNQSASYGRTLKLVWSRGDRKPSPTRQSEHVEYKEAHSFIG